MRHGQSVMGFTLAVLRCSMEWFTVDTGNQREPPFRTYNYIATHYHYLQRRIYARECDAQNTRTANTLGPFHRSQSITRKPQILQLSGGVSNTRNATHVIQEVLSAINIKPDQPDAQTSRWVMPSRCIKSLAGNTECSKHSAGRSSTKTHNRNRGGHLSFRTHAYE